MELHHRDQGPRDAPAVVLLHGGGSRGATWDLFTPALLDAGHRVVVPDLRGHAGSPRSRSYTLDSHRDDVLALLDRLGLDRATLVGHSLGGFAASLVAQEQPDRVTRLVLEDPPAPPRVSEGRLSLGRLLLLSIGTADPRRRYDRLALTSAIAQLRQARPQWWDALPAITAPTLLLSGGPTSHIAPARLAEVAALIPRCELVTLPVGHRIHSTAPDRFRETVMKFLGDAVRDGTPAPTSPASPMDGAVREE
ncbi:alpha/beta fold hydrolase [Dactylosporangium sp. NPDC000521]|uniref:alpha/beta fold hydrolase n=1 Tax=Dactylosporangium sp. NPDC000521 TaxID=3363975 RepID=UPI0036B34D99